MNNGYASVIILPIHHFVSKMKAADVTEKRFNIKDEWITVKIVSPNRSEISVLEFDEYCPENDNNFVSRGEFDNEYFIGVIAEQPGISIISKTVFDSFFEESAFDD